jgi:hypothetical protein
MSRQDVARRVVINNPGDARAMVGEILPLTRKGQERTIRATSYQVGQRVGSRSLFLEVRGDGLETVLGQKFRALVQHPRPDNHLERFSERQ